MKASVKRSRAGSGLAKRLLRDGPIPALSRLRLARTDLVRRIERARAAAFDLRKNVVLGLILAGERKRVAGRHRVIADAGEPRRLRRLACEIIHNRPRAGLALRARRR